MTLRIITLALLLVCFTPDTARAWLLPEQQFSWGKPERAYKNPARAKAYRGNQWAKPRRWCGWWMRTQFGGGPEYNRAWNWSKRGVETVAQVGAVVVWRNHVGYITGRNARGQWIVKSGNDSNRVRERARSVRGAVFRLL